jgi:hypothetical protein
MTPVLVVALAAFPTVDEIIAKLGANHQAFRSLAALDVSYTLSYRHLRGHVQNNEPMIECRLTRDQDDVYASVRYSEGREWTAAWNGTIGTVHHGSNYTIFEVAPPLVFDLQYYVDDLLYPDGHARVEDPEGIVQVPGVTGGPDYWIPDALERNHDKYRVLPNRETWDGAECLVLEWAGRDRLWIDPALGYAIRRREFRRTDGVMRDRVFFRDFQIVSDELWLPRLIEREQYCSKEDPRSLQNQVSGVRTLRVQSLEIVTVPEHDFIVDVPPGVHVHDNVRGIVYDALGPGEDPIAEAEATVRRQLNPGPWRYVGWGVAGVVVLVIAIVGYRLWLARAA